MTIQSPRQSVAFGMLCCGLALVPATRAVAQQILAPAATPAAAIRGSIVNARNLPIVGAVITARGSAVGWTATRSDGSFALIVPPGTYDILVRKGGYTPTTTAVVMTTAPISLRLTLADANLNSVNVGNAKTTSPVPFNTGVSAGATLAPTALADRPQVSLRDVTLELPGLTLAHPQAGVPDTSFVVRGGTIETRVQIDGHAVSAGATGRWNSSYASEPLFDSVEVVKGAGLSGANAGESAFGTVNLRTRDFTGGRQAGLVVGADGFGGGYTTIALSGSLLATDRLNYVFEHTVYGYNGPDSGKIVNDVVAEPNGTALLASRYALTSPLMLGSDLVKLRWHFSGETSLTLGYVGIHGDYSSTGGAYGTDFGSRTIVPSAPNGNGGLQYSSPLYPTLIGTTAPGYTFAHNSSVQINQPLFEAEVRTAIHNDTLLVRPYAGTIFTVLDGTGRGSGPDPSNGNAWKQVTSGAGCSSQQPCYTTLPEYAPFRQQEGDRLQGTTFTLLHPAGEGTFNLSYDYRSDRTTAALGNPFVHFAGTQDTTSAYLTSIPATLARNDDWSLTYSVPISSRLHAYAGEYYTSWKLHYGTIDERVNFSANTTALTTSFAWRDYEHNDPHIGFTWQPEQDTAFRLTAGSAITVPYANLVAGGATYNDPFTGTGTFILRNPALQPESTIAYDLGVDHRFGHETVAAADLFCNTIHNVFATQVSPFNGAILGIPPGSPYNALFATTTIPLNAPLERNYGIELSLTHAPVKGLGYYLATTEQRAYLAELPASFFSARSSLVNGKQLDGSTSIPFTHAYASLTYRNTAGIGASLGADYTGTNNWTNGPAFVVWSSMLRYDLRGGYRAQFSIENLFDASTGTQFASGIAGAGFADVSYGSPLPGSPASYGTTPTTRFAIPPRTLRFQIEAHVGR